jgi:hypothetical protein
MAGERRCGPLLFRDVGGGSVGRDERTRVPLSPTHVAGSFAGVRGSRSSIESWHGVEPPAARHPFDVVLTTVYERDAGARDEVGHRSGYEDFPCRRLNATATAHQPIRPREFAHMLVRLTVNGEPGPEVPAW